MTPDPLAALRSPQGALALAIAALLGVLGLRLLGAAFAPGRPGRTTLAAVGWGTALPLLWAGGQRLLPGPAPEPPAWLRIAGAVLLLLGLVLASRRPPAGAAGRALDSPAVRVAAGLALVLLGQLARGPSAGGAVAAVAAIGALAWAAASARKGRGSTPERPNH